MLRLLAIDTTEETCSAALWYDGGVSERFELAARRHSELILPMVDGLLSAAGITLSQLDALAFARGPGSFTGVRIAAAVIQGLALAADRPVVPVSSLQALAQRGSREHGRAAWLSAFDARMGEVYWGAFRLDADGHVQPAGREQVCAPADVEVPAGDDWCGIGSGWDAYDEVLQQALGFAPALIVNQQVHARDVATLAVAAFADGHAVAADQAVPVYLRDDVAWARP